MSNHLSKSLFSIPRLKKSRSRQQNQPENPTSLCLNALTADDAFLRFAAVPDKTFFSPRNPKRNSIIFLCIPLPPRLFHPQKAPKRILFLTLHSQSAATFFLPAQPRTEFYFLTLHPSPLSRGPRLPRCITIFSVLSAVSPPHGAYIHPTCRIHPTIVPEMRCAAPKRRNFPARKRYGRHTSGRRDGHTR